MDDTRHTRLLAEITGYLRINSEGILDGWDDFMRPVIGESLTGPGIRPRATRLLEIFADLLEGEPYESFSNYIRRVLMDLSGAGYGPSWVLETLDIFIEYLSGEIPRHIAEAGQTVYGGDPDEYRDCLNSFIRGETGYLAMRDLSLVVESIAAEVNESRDESSRERELLLKITGALHSAMSKREIFSILLPVLAELVPAAQSAAVMLFDERQVLRLTDVHNLDDFQAVKSEVKLEGSIYRDILLHGEDRILERSRLSEKVDLIFRRATTIGDKVLRAPPLSIAVIPIHADKRPIGGIAIFNYAHEGSFGETELSVLRVVTRQLVLALERVFFSEKAGRQHRRIRTVLEMAESVKYNHPPREVAETILGVVRRATDFTRGVIFHLEDNGNLIPTGAIDVEAPLDVRSLDAPEKPEQLLVLPLQRGEIIHLDDLSDITPFSSADLPVPVKGVERGSLIVAPLAIDKDAVGLLLMYHREPHKFDDEEIDLIKVICQQGAHFILRSLEHERYVRDQAIQEDEQGLARRMQLGLFPRSFRTGKWEAQTSLIQARRMAGDFAIVEPTGDGLMCAVGDICGRGQPAGMVMMRSYGLLKENLTSTGDPGQTLTEVNRILYRQFDGSHRRFASNAFVNCSLAIGKSGGKMELASAGTPPPLLYHGSTGEVFVPENTGIPLGISPDTKYESSELKVSRGDKLLLYTDGLVTGEDTVGKPFGIEELKELFGRSGRFPARVILDLISGAVSDETDGGRLGDDRTALIIAADDPKLKRLSFKGSDEDREAACDTALKAVRRRTKDRDMLFAVRLALHEIVKNAIEHGNRGDTSLLVHLTYLVGEDFVHLAVRDSGTGFDPELLKRVMGSAGILKDKGRGFIMVKQLMDRVWYDPSAGELNLFTRFPLPEAELE